MTHIWTVTTGWDYEITCDVTFAFDNEVSARRVASEIDAIRLKYEAALQESTSYRVNECVFPPDEYVLEATGQRIPVADYTEIQGPIQVLS